MKITIKERNYYVARTSAGSKSVHVFVKDDRIGYYLNSLAEVALCILCHVKLGHRNDQFFGDLCPLIPDKRNTVELEVQGETLGSVIGYEFFSLLNGMAAKCDNGQYFTGTDWLELLKIIATGGDKESTLFILLKDW